MISKGSKKARFAAPSGSASVPRLNCATAQVAKLKLAEAIFKREYHRIVTARRPGAPFGQSVRVAAPRASLLQLAQRRRRRAPGSRQEHLLREQESGSHGALAEAIRLHAFDASDGAQAALISHFRDMIYIPIETSGEGEINAHSRVHMISARRRLKRNGSFRSAWSVPAYRWTKPRLVEANPEMKRPMYRVPQSEGVAGTAANFVLLTSRTANGVRRNGHGG